MIQPASNKGPMQQPQPLDVHSSFSCIWMKMYKFPQKRRSRLRESAECLIFTTLSTLLLLIAKECPRGDLNPHGLAANGF